MRLCRADYRGRGRRDFGRTHQIQGAAKAGLQKRRRAHQIRHDGGTEKEVPPAGQQDRRACRLGLRSAGDGAGWAGFWKPGFKLEFE